MKHVRELGPGARLREQTYSSSIRALDCCKDAVQVKWEGLICRRLTRRGMRVDCQDHEQVRERHRVAVRMAHLVDRTVEHFQRVVELVLDLDG